MCPRVGVVLGTLLCTPLVALGAHKTRAAATVLSVAQITNDGVNKENLLTDGSTSYVTEHVSGTHVIAKFDLGVSKPSFVTTGFSDAKAIDFGKSANLLITPLGKNQEKQFWAVSTNQQPGSRIGELEGHDPSWSPDGKLLIYGNGSALYKSNGDGTSAERLFEASGYVFSPRFSPNGKKIRFSVSEAENKTTIWEINSDGSNPHQLLASWQSGSAACCGRWTADSRFYVFQVTQSSPTPLTTLWAMSEKRSTAPIQITGGPISFSSPSPLPDPRRIRAIGVRPVAEPVKYDLQQRKFVPLLPDVSATDLEFSPDREWITYVAIPDRTLWLCRRDGSERRQLSMDVDHAALPHWSPDGKQIAYVRMAPGQSSRIAIVDARTGHSNDLFEETRGQIDANWSPDGKRIMFGYLHDGDHINIRVVDVNTKQSSDVPGSEGLFSPRWSPDGRYVAALSPDFTTVMLFDYQTKQWTSWLTEPAGAVSYPTWSADSKYLYFDDLVTEEESIRKVKIGEKRAEKVFKLEGIERYPGPFGLWSGRIDDHSWLFVRDRSSEEVYELTVALP
jgi:Tol biopolymer transport system component